MCLRVCLLMIVGDLPLRDRRRGWKREGLGALPGRGASCCVSRCRPTLSGRSTCSTLFGAPSPSPRGPTGGKVGHKTPRHGHNFFLFIYFLFCSQQPLRLVVAFTRLFFSLFAFSKRKLCNSENFRIKNFDKFRCF